MSFDFCFFPVLSVNGWCGGDRCSPVEIANRTDRK